MTGLRVLDSESREELAARAVLEAIGAIEVGHATFTAAVANLAGGDAAAQTAATRALPVLMDEKRMVTIDLPVGSGPRSKLRRYRIVDPYLRFWFRYCAPHLGDMARGRSDLATDRFDRDFPTWRGKAIEPVVLDGLSRLAGREPALTGVTLVGGSWDRSGQTEVDVVAADRRRQVALVGTVKWRRRKPVTTAELAEVAATRGVIPAAGAARLAAVCPAGVDRRAAADLVLDAGRLLDAFASREV